MPQIKMPLSLELANENKRIPKITVLNDDSRILSVTMCLNGQALFVDQCTVVGHFMNSDGEKLSVNGAVTEGKVEVTLPSDQSFMKTGLMKCSISLSNNGTPSQKLTTPTFNIFVENTTTFIQWVENSI